MNNARLKTRLSSVEAGLTKLDELFWSVANVLQLELNEWVDE